MTSLHPEELPSTSASRKTLNSAIKRKKEIEIQNKKDKDKNYNNLFLKLIGFDKNTFQRGPSNILTCRVMPYRNQSVVKMKYNSQKGTPL